MNVCAYGLGATYSPIEPRLKDSVISPIALARATSLELVGGASLLSVVYQMWGAHKQ